MKVLFDTSTLVAALLVDHPAHAAARPWLVAADVGTVAGVVSAHALAELWASLTAMPLRARIAGRDAQAMVDAVASFCTVLAIDGEVEARAIDRCVERNLRSGAVYDAIHLVTAEVAGAEAVITLNAKDFERLTTAAVPRILVPGVDAV